MHAAEQVNETPRDAVTTIARRIRVTARPLDS